MRSRTKNPALQSFLTGKGSNLHVFSALQADTGKGEHVGANRNAKTALVPGNQTVQGAGTKIDEPVATFAMEPVSALPVCSAVVPLGSMRFTVENEGGSVSMILQITQGPVHRNLVCTFRQAAQHARSAQRFASPG